MQIARTVLMMAAVTSGLAGRAWAQEADLFGWGSNGYGQINTPSNLTGVTQVACGLFHTYALKNDGTLLGWGNNDYGQINTDRKSVV